MCTVSYLPTTSGFILTSNRDEAPARHAVKVHTADIHGADVIYPRDPHAGGTWYAISDHGYVACLLNGAYVPFVTDPRYTYSRGLVVLDSFRYTDIDLFGATYDFSKTAPFTLVLYRAGTLHQLIWDGTRTDHSLLDPGTPHFWSSVTLYPEPTRQWRKALFEQWMASHRTPEQSDIMEFHRYGGRGDAENDFVMNRDERVRTLSISSVSLEQDKLRFHYLDLQDHANDDVRILDITTDVATKT